MTIGLESAISQIEQAKASWDSVVSRVPEQFPINNISISSRHLSQWFDEVIRIIKIANSQENPDMAMVAIHFPGIVSQCQNLPTYAQQLTSNPGHLPFLQNTLNTLWGIRASLLWILPPNVAEWQNWPARTGEIQEKLQLAAQYYTEYSAFAENIRNLAKSLEGDISALKTLLPDGNKTLQQIQQLSQDASSAKTSAEGSAVNASAEKEKAIAYAAELSQIVGKQTSLFEYFEKRKEEIEALLEGANKVGLARSSTIVRANSKNQKAFGKGYSRPALSLC